MLCTGERKIVCWQNFCYRAVKIRLRDAYFAKQASTWRMRWKNLELACISPPLDFISTNCDTELIQGDSGLTARSVNKFTLEMFLTNVLRLSQYDTRHCRLPFPILFYIFRHFKHRILVLKTFIACLAHRHHTCFRHNNLESCTTRSINNLSYRSS